jgi:DNA polymerase-3 subunit delta
MIIFIHGQDTYRASKKLAEIKAKFVKEVDPNRLNLVVLEAGINAQSLQNELYASPFLAKRRMLILKNFIFKNKNQDVFEILMEFVGKESAGTDDNIVVFFEEKKSEEKDEEKVTKKTKEKGALELKEKKKLFEMLEKSKFAILFEPLSPAQLNTFVIDEAKKRGAVINSGTAQQLLTVTGDDLWQICSELDKLSSYAQGREIKKADIELMSGQYLEDNIFQLIDAIAQKNTARALKLLEDFFALDQNVFYLFTMIVRQFRILVQIKDLTNKSSVSSDQIAKSLKIHSFVAQKSLAQAQKFKDSDLVDLYGKMVELEKRLKSSYADGKLLIEMFVASIA